MSDKKISRRKAREQAFILVFEKLFNDDMTMEQIISNAIQAEVIKPDEFAFSLVGSVDENCDAIDEKINENLKGWTMDRISKVSVALLRLAIAEILYFDDIPSSVSINEAVELAKVYAPNDDASFINGLLGSVVKKIEA